jgi:aldehyde dehydrogenase (NAD+)
MSVQTLNINGRDVELNTGLFINGEFTKPKVDKTFPVEDPRTGKTVIEVSEGSAEDVDIAVKAARQTMESESWSELNPATRGMYLLKLADLMEKHFDDILAIEMLDTGKTKKQAANLDLPGSIGTLRYYAGWADKVQGVASSNVPGTFAYTRREPVGVCGQIIPWKCVLKSTLQSEFTDAETAFHC